jgi:preprotein translocase subunit SecG
MLNFINLLTELVYINDTYEFIHKTLLGVMIVLMAISAIAAIVLILLQPSNSSGIDALGGSSETFFGKNKGKSIEAKMKKWTWICLAVLVVFAIVFYILQLESIWA